MLRRIRAGRGQEPDVLGVAAKAASAMAIASSTAASSCAAFRNQFRQGWKSAPQSGLQGFEVGVGLSKSPQRVQELREPGEIPIEPM